jgi:hypothetical protein
MKHENEKYFSFFSFLKSNVLLILHLCHLKLNREIRTNLSSFDNGKLNQLDHHILLKFLK